MAFHSILPWCLSALVAAACGGPTRSTATVDDANALSKAAPAPGPGDRVEVTVALDVVSGEGWGSERLPPDASSGELARAARGCADAVPPADQLPVDAQWVVGLSWDHTYAHAADDVVADRSLDDSAPVPAGLAKCILAKVPALAGPSAADVRVDGLIAIRSRGWVAAHGAGRPVDDPARSMAFSITGTTRSGCRLEYIHPVGAIVVGVVRRCTTAAAPARQRTPEDAWRVSVSLGAPEPGEGGFCLHGPDEGFSGSTSTLPFSDAPPGFVDCVRAGLTGAEYAGVTLHIEATTAGFRDEHRGHYEGVLGRGNGVP